MALVLKRVTHPYECYKCQVTGEILEYGAYYYEDDVDGFIVSFDYYYDTKQAKKQEAAEYKIRHALSIEEYKERMLQAEKEFLAQTAFDRPLEADNLYIYNPPEPSTGGNK